MKRYYNSPLIFCCLLFIASSVFAADERLPIGSISTAGNISISSDEVLSRVRSRVGQVFNPSTAAEDAKRIAELPGVEYSYYNTTVADGEIKLTFVVVERNIVRSIVFSGNHKYKSKTLKRKLDFKKGDYLEPAMAEVGRAAIAEHYRKKGFAFAEVGLDSENLSSGNVVYNIYEGPRVKIAAVKFAGNKALKTKLLKKTVGTKKTKWVFWPGYYTEEKISNDIVKLQNLYYKKGFLDVEIKAQREFTEDKSKIRITFVIDEGAAYIVNSVIIKGNEHFTAEKLRAGLKLEAGQIYSEQRASADVDHLLKLYRENGFIDVEVERNVRFISANRVDAEFEIKEGERFRIGRIKITGNEQTQDKVVRRVLDEYDFQPGKWYNIDLARGDGTGYLEKEIRSTVLAESATIVPSGKEPGQRDAEVSIIEGRTGMIMLGAGVTSDSGFIGQMVFEQRNFDIRDWPESFSEFITGRAFKGAGQSLRITVQPGTEVSEYLISFREPYLYNRPISLDVVSSSWMRDRECYDESRLKGYIGLERRYKNGWRRGVGLRVENVEVDSVDSDAPKEITSVKGDNVLMGVAFSAERDRTDDRFNPTRGSNFGVSYEQVAGDHTFGILSGVYRHYRVLREDLDERKTVLATKFLGAAAVGDAPPFEKFYAGGTGTYGIRGFDYRGVSTRSGSDDDPVGSDWIFLASAEATVPLQSETFAALFFVDSGIIDSGGYRVSVGTGLQILVPQWFGPVPMRLELATPVMKDGGDETQVFSFSVGRLF